VVDGSLMLGMLLVAQKGVVNDLLRAG
jgi:hypothetical protein